MQKATDKGDYVLQNATSSTGQSGQTAPIKDPQASGKLTGSGEHLPPLHLDELELLHHFVTETCMTLSDREESHNIWRLVVPQIAFQHDFLMRGILAISALHLGTLRPMKQMYFTNIAIQHQDAALRSFRDVMTRMDASNGDAFFAMSTLIVVYGFESPKASDGLGMFRFNEHSDEWLPLIRGVNSIIQNVWGDIKRGRLSGLLHDHDQSPVTKNVPQSVDGQLSLLEQLCNDMSSTGEDKAACLEAAYQLRYVYTRIINKETYECDVSLSFLWPVIVPQHYLKMLNEGRSEALIILAHYCTVLDRLDRYWWLKGWASHIVHHIQKELDAAMQHWIQWPISIVTLHPVNLITHSGAQSSSDNRTQDSGSYGTAIGDQLARTPGEIKELQRDSSGEWTSVGRDENSLPEEQNGHTNDTFIC
ncbi:uncharacterized protein KY384_001046 [Bacidia gigantensis]|uniref:uncharacterized protein n=1 Tax=Bacidia gigantensis TaxID=2732470 RepID=UPI001D04BAAD|nr:uncharacterized protein KY384_001046 [Bacidia gigantensis]KAG8534202.1 hypothetical protein KY384_001046 [Bacidia gigantensis]